MVYADIWVLYDMLRNTRDSVDRLILGVGAYTFHILLDYLDCLCICVHCQ